MEGTSSKKESKVKVYLHRYFIDAMSAMAQGLFASLLIGTIISTLGTQLNIPLLDEIGGYAKSAAGPAMAVAIGYALQAPPLVLFSLVASWRRGKHARRRRRSSRGARARHHRGRAR